MPAGFCVLLLGIPHHIHAAESVVKAFLKAEEFGEVKPKFKSLKAARVVGTYEYNSFSKEFGVIADVIEESEFKMSTRMDDSEEKRV